MPYDFSTHVERRACGSSKWDAMLKECPDVPEGTVPLSVADMELLNPPEVTEALHELIDAGPLGYTEATPRFLDACVSWQKRRHGWSPDPSWIVTSPGVIPALYTAVRALTEPGDAVIVQPPVYGPFSAAVRDNERALVENPLVCNEGHWEMDFDGLEAACADPATTMLILCSPHNPVGRVWTAEELRRVIDICSAHNVTIVADEIHDDLTMFGHAHHTLMSLMDEAERAHAVVCTAPSKTFNLAGCQASVIYVASPELRERFSKGFSAIGQHGLNAFAYAATTAAYERGDAWLDELLSLVEKNYEALHSWAAERHPELTVAPLEGTYLAWVDFRAWGMDADALECFLKHEARLWLSDGRAFGEQGAGFGRVNLACPTEVLLAALTRLDEACRRCHVTAAQGEVR